MAGTRLVGVLMHFSMCVHVVVTAVFIAAQSLIMRMRIG